MQGQYCPQSKKAGKIWEAAPLQHASFNLVLFLKKLHDQF